MRGMQKKKKQRRRKNLIIYSFFRVFEISGFSFRLYLEDKKQTCDNYPPLWRFKRMLSAGELSL